MKTLLDFFNRNDSLPVEIILFLVVLILIWVFTRLNHLAFKRVKKKQSGIHLLFLERVNGALILIIGGILAFSVFGGAASIWKGLLGSTAVISAVVAFAAQDAIKDILAGMMISIYKPFEVGNRIELEDGTAGIVEDLTMRHAVIRIIDTQRLIIPNSKLNAMSLKNFSYQSNIRSREFNFYVSYDTNIEEAMEVVREAVMQSGFSIPGRKTSVGMEYSPVYFMSFEDSSLRLTTTVYFPVSVASEVLISDINLRVTQAFTMHGIEIPYQYINILQPTPGEQTLDHGSLWKKTPHRGRQIADIVVDSHGHGMQEAIDETAALGTECGLEKKDTLRLRLLSEELFGLMKSVVGNVSGHYWVDQEDQLFAIHLETDVASMDREMRRQLLSVSSSGQNAAATGLIGKIRDMISVMMLPREGGRNEAAAPLPGSVGANGAVGSSGAQAGNGGSYVWSMQKHKAETSQESDSSDDSSWDELEKSIVSSIADDVSISIDGTTVQITIIKQF